MSQESDLNVLIGLMKCPCLILLSCKWEMLLSLTATRFYTLELLPGPKTFAQYSLAPQTGQLALWCLHADEHQAVY